MNVPPPRLLAITPLGVGPRELATRVATLTAQLGPLTSDCCVLVRAPGAGTARLAALLHAAHPPDSGLGLGLNAGDTRPEALAELVAGLALAWLQLPERAGACADWRRALCKGGQDALIGRSVHAPAAVGPALASGADHAVLSPIHPTASKPGVAPLGLAALAAACRAHPGRLLALGGVAPHNARALFAAGAAGVAAIRSAWDGGAVALLTAGRP